jgi:anti-sigma28 factor (negative regulator of flagellin synthesis)
MKMLTFAGQNSKAGIVERRTEGPMSDVSGNKSRTGTIRHAGKKKSLKSASFSNTKVCCIRRQLANGKYDIDDRLNVVLDKLLETLAS